MKQKLCVLAPVHWKAQMGGAQYQIKCLLDHLVGLGQYEIHYLAHRVPDDTEIDGYAIHRIGAGGPIPRLGYIQDARHLLRQLKALQPDVIYQRIGCAYTGIASHFSLRSGCRLVWHSTSDTDVNPELKTAKKNRIRAWLERSVLNYGIRHAHVIVTQTNQQARLLLENFGRRPDAVVPNFQPEPEESLEKSTEIRIVWIANLKRLKQPEVFLRLAQALQGVRNAQFVMIGGGGFRGGQSTWLEALMKDIRATPNLEYRGTIPQEEVNAELARSHILVNTSLYEGFSNTFIQAWMRRVPVVSLNVNPDGVFDKGTVGFHAGNEQKLAEIVRRLIEDVPLRESAAKSARSYAIEFHSMENAVRLEEIIRHAAESGLKRNS